MMAVSSSGGHLSIHSSVATLHSQSPALAGHLAPAPAPSLWPPTPDYVESSDHNWQKNMDNKNRLKLYFTEKICTRISFIIPGIT